MTTARRVFLILFSKCLLTILLQLQVAEIECAVPIDIVTERITLSAMRKPPPAIVPMIPDKVPIITSTRRRIATTNPRRGFYEWWNGLWGWTFETYIVYYTDVTLYEYFTFYDSYYFKDDYLPFYTSTRDPRLPKLLKGAEIPMGQVPTLLHKMASKPEFHDYRLAKIMSHLPPLKYPDYFRGWQGQKKKK